MSLNHGINTFERDTQFVGVTKGKVGVPLFVGALPIHKVGAAFNGGPILLNNIEEAKALGWSDAWRDDSGNPKWNLCQAAYAHLLLFAMAPCFVVNVYDPATNKTAVAAADKSVSDHAVELTEDAIDDSGLVVKNGETTLTKGTDYAVIYTDTACRIELLSTGTAYSATTLNVAFNKADFTGITASVIEAAFEKAELCKTMWGIVPDLFCAPGWSKNPAVAAVMTAKARSINGLYRAKAVVDIDTAAAAADTYDDVYAYKNANGYDDADMIVCWPLAKVGDKLFDLSVLVCGAMSRIDADNGDLPYESPSNKAVPVTGLVNAAGTDIYLTVQQADALSVADGVVTALNFGGFVLWGNYTGCAPAITDTAKCFIPTGRMQDYLCNAFVNAFWGYVDRPLSRVVIDAIVNSFNSFLDGLIAEGALLGGSIEYVDDNNPAADLLAGRFRLDLQMASPVPAQRIDMYSEFSVSMFTDALNG